MVTTSAAFDGYVEDYSSARGEALKAVEAYASCSNPLRRDELMQEARNCIDEVERYVRVLENEAKTGTPAAKRKMMEQVHKCRTQVASLKSSLEKALLVGDSKHKAAAVPLDSGPKEQAVRVADLVDRNGRHLDEAQRTLAETEAIAANVSNNLVEQRNQLDHAQLDVYQAQEDTEEAGSHLRRLGIKALTSRVCLIFVILVLIVAIALVSYYRWWPKSQKDYLGLQNRSNSSSST